MSVAGKPRRTGRGANLASFAGHCHTLTTISTKQLSEVLVIITYEFIFANLGNTQKVKLDRSYKMRL